MALGASKQAIRETSKNIIDNATIAAYNSDSKHRIRRKKCQIPQ
jgi:hypothetical protein